MRKKRPKSFFLRKGCLPFQKFSISTTSQVLNSSSKNFHSNFQNTPWTLKKFSLRFVTLDNTRTIGPQTFVLVKAALFWNVCFYRPLLSYWNKLITCEIFVKRPCKTSQSVLWGFLHSITAEEIGENLFFNDKIAFFQKVVFSTTP